jgi:hypothetical protein
MAKQENETGATALVVPQAGELSVQQVIDQAAKIQEVMHAIMKRDEHFGIIPGTKKPSLLKAGAEKLCLVFRLDPQYSIIEKSDGDHLTVFSTCTLYHIPTGNRMGSGMGSCSTKEQKYAYRQSNRACPRCGAETVFKDKKGVGYYCWDKKGGCGAQLKDAESIALIEEQNTGRVPNPDIADQYNTVLKMANKRSLIAAVLNVTAASDLFTQDLEDLKGKQAAAPADDDDINASFDREHPPTDEQPVGNFSEAWHHETNLREPDGGVKATRIALIKKATDKLGKEMGIQYLTVAARELGKTSETLTIDEMLAISERITKLKPPAEGARA